MKREATTPKTKLKILKLIAKGCSNREIANILNFSYYTIKTYIEEMFVEYNVKDRTQLVVEGLKLEKISLDEL